MTEPEPSAAFRELISKAEEDAWLEDGDLKDDGLPFSAAQQKMKYEGRFQNYLALSDEWRLTDVLSAYLATGIPKPRTTAFSCWSITCFGKNESLVYRVNLNWQEVFAAFKSSEVLSWTFQVARSPLNCAWPDPASFLADTGVGMRDHRYRPGGEDQVRLEVKGYSEVLRLLELQPIRQAIRMMNLRLLSKQNCVNNRSHCVSLAEHALSSTKTD